MTSEPLKEKKRKKREAVKILFGVSKLAEGPRYLFFIDQKPFHLDLVSLFV